VVEGIGPPVFDRKCRRDRRNGGADRQTRDSGRSKAHAECIRKQRHDAERGRDDRIVWQFSRVQVQFRPSGNTIAFLIIIRTKRIAPSKTTNLKAGPIADKAHSHADDDERDGARGPSRSS
jgi:hypothetical protein